MTDKKFKVLICGDVEGKFNSFFTKIEQTNKKCGPFDLLLCVGNFFGVNNVEWTGFKNGFKRVAIPTYILGPNNQDALDEYSNLDNGELCENVTYLGKRGTYTVNGGLRIAYLSGLEQSSQDCKDYNFTREDVTSLRDACLRGQGDYRGVDILVTSQWPKDISNLDKKQEILEENTSPLISWLATQIKPRYHLVGLNGKFYERAPYRNLSSDGTIATATRFLALARFGNPEKQKWLYAANLMPISNMRMMDLCQSTTDETHCPYGPELMELISTGKEQSGGQFFYDMNARQDDNRRKRKFNRNDGPEKRQRPVFDQEKCWFCLASPQVEKHLVISIGETVYLALAKGGLLPDHLLITPVTHHQATSEIPDKVKKEIEQFKEALRKYFAQEDRVPVFYERNYKTSHLQIQVIGIPKRAQTDLKEIFEDEASGHDLQLEQLPPFSELSQLAPPGVPYFCAELPTGVTLFTRAKKNFPLQFGRDVLASGPILNMEDRIDWRECILPKEDEIGHAMAFREKYKPFDFTL